MKLMVLYDDIYLTYLINSATYQVHRFDDFEKALAIHKNEEFDVVIVEKEIPEMNKKEVVNSIKQHKPNAYVIIIGSDLDREHPEMVEETGAYALFNKPLNLSSFVDTLIELEKEVQ